MYRLSSSDIVLVCILAFVIDFLSRLTIGYVAFIQTFVTDLPVWLQFQFVYWLLVYTFFPVCLQDMLFLYRHLVQTFQFGYSSSLFTGFWYRLSSLVIGNVAFIQTFGTDFPVWLQFQFVYWLLSQTFFPVWLQASCFYIDIWYRLSSSAIVLVCILAFGIYFPVWLQAMLLLYRNLVQSFQFGCSSSLYAGF